MTHIPGVCANQTIQTFPRTAPSQSAPVHCLIWIPRVSYPNKCLFTCLENKGTYDIYGTNCVFNSGTELING